MGILVGECQGVFIAPYLEGTCKNAVGSMLPSTMRVHVKEMKNEQYSYMLRMDHMNPKLFVIHYMLHLADICITFATIKSKKKDDYLTE